MINLPARQDFWAVLVVLTLVVLVVALGTAPVASAQTPVSASPVTLEARFFGAGGMVRQGEWAGVQVELTDAGSGKASRRVLVQLHQRDVDGDTLLSQREFTLTVGVARAVWLYQRMPWSMTNTTDFTVSVRELSERESAGDPSAGTELLAKRIRAPLVAGRDQPLIGVIGRNDAALNQYRMEPASGRGSMGTWHETYGVATGIEPRWLPDQWMGLEQFEALVWTEGDPQALTEGRHEALIEWVQRGGHLVIVPPVVGSTWFAPRNPLAAIMPNVEVDRLEGRSLEPYRNILTVPEVAIGRPLPTSTVIYSFTPRDGATTSEAARIISGVDGCVVVRRIVGTGMVTVVGLDVRHRGLTATGLLAAESLWHPILGKRFDILTAQQQQRFRGSSPLGSVSVDGFIGDDIAKGAAAGVGVLLALAVFATYWLLAGPGGFALLKARRWSHHAWVAFVATVGVFAGVAWTGAKAISPSRYEATHLTFLDQVYGQGVTRARMFASCLLPVYGEATIAVGESGLDEAFTQCITPWDEPGSGSLLAFPDQRAYAWSMADPQRLRVPARSTIKQVRADWMGGPRWGNITPVSDGDAPAVRSQIEVGGNHLRGKLMHDLGATMRNVRIVYCSRLRPEAMQPIAKDRPRSFVYIWSDGDWAPGVESAIDLSEGLETRNATMFGFFEDHAPKGAMGGLPGDRQDVHESNQIPFLSFFSSIEGLDYDRTRPRNAMVKRNSSFGLDLSKWLTQPCLIIIGEIDIDEARELGAPVPLFYGTGDNLRPLPASGRTIVRWIYPLPDRPLALTGERIEPLPEDRPTN